eukprot:CAMPEP_0197069786 /NCGR_PEP_ID=MMETSP1384-20130603/195607_1 /TAXON_ID=29189 /ORGANISM="Ammonia sp." /LENGTH=78 /DNA_ID=CAMNT_0042507961 /DNA_START=1 /DNA_END=234 /DNA_ORIENTATION=+
MQRSLLFEARMTVFRKTKELYEEIQAAGSKPFHVLGTQLESESGWRRLMGSGNQLDVKSNVDGKWYLATVIDANEEML